MLTGNGEDTADTTTLEHGADAIEGLLSDSEDQQTREAPPAKTPKIPEPEIEGDEADEEPEEDAAPADDEGVDEDGEEQEPAKPEPRKLRVKVDGEELEVTEEEAAKGYSRTADYTRKTQALAAERQAFLQQEQAVRDERQRYATSLAQLEQVLKDAAPVEPDWDTLRTGDPAVFAATWAAWDQHKQRVEAVSAESARAQQKVAADQQAARQQYLETERAKLVDVLPSWKDDKVAKTEKAEIAAYARSRGYTDAELAEVTDHRIIKILRDAAMFEKSGKTKPAIEEKLERARDAGEKVARPGSSAPKVKTSELTRSKQALAKTGRLDDAQAAIQLLLG